jgi:hypothetical protein
VEESIMNNKKKSPKEYTYQQKRVYAQLRLYRKLALIYLGGKCASCCTVSKLQIHHIDGNYLNEEDSNLTLLCGNCHKKVHSASNVQLLCNYQVGLNQRVRSQEDNSAKVQISTPSFIDPKINWGRSYGGKHSEPMRNYWRVTQQLCRGRQKSGDVGE